MPRAQTAEKPNGAEEAILAPSTSAQADESKDYQFDNPERIVEIPWGENTKVKFLLEKPESKDYEEHERNVIRRTLVVDGTQMDDSNPHNANTEFFDRLVKSAVALRDGETVKEFSRDECLNFNFETKNAVIAGMSQSTFEVLQDDEFAGLFEANNDVVVRQKVGNVDDPDYVIDYTMTPLKKSERLDFAAAVQIKRDVKARKTVVRTELHLLKKGKKLFAPHFKSLTGGRLDAGPYADSRKADFLSQVDDMFQMLVIDAMVAAYGKGQD